MKKIFSVLIILFAAFALTACRDEDQNGPEPDDIDQRVTFNMSLYENAQRNSRITRQDAAPYHSTILNRTFNTGDLQPVWDRIGTMANIQFNDVAPTQGTNGEMWTEIEATNPNFNNIDFINGSAEAINRNGIRGGLLNLAPFLQNANYMPNFYAMLEANPAIRAALTQPNNGIYLTPYFDGIDEIENMFLARIDWIEALLNLGSGIANYRDIMQTPFTIPTAYQPITPIGAFSYSVTVANADGTTRVVNKTRPENPIVMLRALGPTATGEQMLTTFMEYLIATYGGTLDQPGQGYAQWSDIFAGTDASYDTDEMVALMYVIMATEQYILRNTGWTYSPDTTRLVMYFPRELNNSRRQQFMRGLEMFGVRGVLSRNNQNLFFDADGQLHDARAQQEYVDAVTNGLAAWSTDGLIPNLTPGSIWENGFNIRNDLQLGLNQRFGFLMFDFNATQTLVGNMDAGRAIDEDFNFGAILPPVVNWGTQWVRADGPGQAGTAAGIGTGAVTNNTPNNRFFHFTESTRAMRADGWGVAAHVANDPVRLARALFLMDQMYNHDNVLEGHYETIGNLHLYGPREYHDGFFEYMGALVPAFSADAMSEMQRLRAGSHIDWLRRDLGATLGIGHVRGMGLEFQTLSSNGIEGINRINTAVQAGTFILSGLQGRIDPALFRSVTGAEPTNPFFNQVPPILPLTGAQNNLIGTTTFRTHTNEVAIPNLIVHGFTSTATTMTPAAYFAIVNETNQYPIFIASLRDAFSFTQRR